MGLSETLQQLENSGIDTRRDTFSNQQEQNHACEAKSHRDSQKAW
jgi:hypothetical protein